MPGEIQASITGGVLTLTIAAEGRANAMTHAMTQELSTQLSRAEDDTDIGAVVITGAGQRAFCSGHDITELVEDPTSAYDPSVNAAFQAPRELSKPTIAAINGAAFAGGLNLALACDIRIASTRASFAATGTKLALLPLAGQLSVMPSLVGPGVALDMLLRSRPVDAQRAYDVGLVSELVSPEHLTRLAAETGAYIASIPADLNAVIKRAVWSSVVNVGREAEEIEVSEAVTFGRAPAAMRRLREFLHRK